MTNTTSLSRVKIGTAGWSFPDWEGYVYPRGFTGDRLTYLMDFINLIEINTTFYSPADPRSAEGWAKRAVEHPPFIFTAKLLQDFTHERGPIEPVKVRDFMDGIAPLVEAKVFGALLMQFPWSFRQSDKNLLHLERLRDTFGSLSLAVEVRHASWDNPEFLGFLRERGIAFVNLDQPLMADSLRPSAHKTAAFVYVRMHGRNEKDWFRKEASRDERYNYLYPRSALESWVPRLKQLEKGAEIIFIVMNNHYKGQALSNAIELKHLYWGDKVMIPEQLFDPYPQMASIASNPPAQIELF